MAKVELPVVVEVAMVTGVVGSPLDEDFLLMAEMDALTSTISCLTSPSAC